MNRLIFIISLLVFSCTTLEEVKPNSLGTKPRTVTGIVRLYLCVTSQSNAQNMMPALFNYEYATGVHGFNFTTKTWNDSLSWNQLQKVSATYRYSPLITLAIKLKQKYPNDELYFLQYSQGQTDVYSNWNVHNTTSGSLFKKSCDYIDLALASMPTPDETTVISLIGETDSEQQIKADSFYQNITDNYDSLKARYGVDRFFVYMARNNTAYNNTVRNAQLTLEANDPIVEAISIPIKNTAVVPWVPYYQSGNVHMNVTGVRIFVDSVMLKIP